MDTQTVVAHEATDTENRTVQGDRETGKRTSSGRKVCHTYGKNITWGDNLHIPNVLTVGDGVIVGDGVFFDHNNKIGEHVEIGEGTTFGPHVQIGDGCKIGPGCKIEREVVIGPNVTVGPNCVLLPGVIIDAHAELGAGVHMCAYSSAGEGTVIGDGGTVYARVALPSHTLIGARCQFAATPTTPRVPDDTYVRTDGEWHVLVEVTDIESIAYRGAPDTTMPCQVMRGATVG